MSKTLKYIGTMAFAVLLSGPAAAQKVTLDVTAWKGNEAEPAGLAEIIEKFEAENPDIDVELSYISRSDTDIVIPPRLQGGNPPDVLMVDMPLAKLWGEAGLLVDFGTDREWYGRVPDDLRSAITLDGKAFIMPLEVIGMGLYTNMALLGQVGIDSHPLTIDELKAACGALSDAGINPMLMTGGFPITLFTIANGLEAGTTPVGDLGNGSASFVDDAGFNSALDTIRELAAAKCFDPKEMAGVDPWSTALSEFKSGNFAMLPQGAWNIANFSSDPDFNFVFGPIPSSSGVGVAPDLFGIGWSLSTGSDNLEAGRKFAEYFSRPEVLQIMLDAESAYTPFDDGASGTPELAEAYDAARAAGGIRNYPFALLQWPKPLDQEAWDSLTGLLLNLDKDNSEVLERWDETVEDNL